MMATAALVSVPDPADRLREAFRADVLAGLALPQKAISARWFYDQRGSELFEEITRLPEYYPTRAERAILAERCAEMALVIGTGRAVVEFGAGSASKTPLLLGGIAPCAYLAVDISGDFLRDSCDRLAAQFPGLPIHTLEGDFTHPICLPASLSGKPLLGFFPGSTIGNLTPPAAIDLLRAMRETLGPEAMLLIGLDRIKERRTLLAAYDDAAGVTAGFNLNLVARINRELDGTIPTAALRHRAVWDERLARIEMHLEAMRGFAFEVAGRRYAMAEGETIHTENSHKYDDRSAAMLLLGGGWTPLREFTDIEDQFMVVLAKASPAHSAP